MFLIRNHIHAYLLICVYQPAAIAKMVEALTEHTHTHTHTHTYIYIYNMSTNPQAISKMVEALKERATIRQLMGSLKTSLPEVYQALVAERDVYMASSLLKSGAKSAVAVVGMAHMDGIERELCGNGYAVSTCMLTGGVEAVKDQ
jgi:pheromone shutdown protein TraB